MDQIRCISPERQRHRETPTDRDTETHTKRDRERQRHLETHTEKHQQTQRGTQRETRISLCLSSCLSQRLCASLSLGLTPGSLTAHTKLDSYTHSLFSLIQSSRLTAAAILSHSAFISSHYHCHLISLLLSSRFTAGVSTFPLYCLPSVLPSLCRWSSGNHLEH